MNIFEITIEAKADKSWPVSVMISDSDELKRSSVKGWLTLDLASLPSQIEPKAYGSQLGEALFCDGIRRAFERALDRSEDGVRVLLVVEAKELRALRWERLCAPDDEHWQHLALNARTPFSFSLPSAADRRFPSISRDDLRAPHPTPGWIIPARPNRTSIFRRHLPLTPL